MGDWETGRMGGGGGGGGGGESSTVSEIMRRVADIRASVVGDSDSSSEDDW